MSPSVPTILNRNLAASDVPLVRASHLDPMGGGHPSTWAMLRRFSLTFDTDAYLASNGGQSASERLEACRARSDGLRGLPVTDLRMALAALLDTETGVDGAFVDQFLDAIYLRLSGEAVRPRVAEPPYEVGLGEWGAAHGSGQVRFWFKPVDDIDREDLFDHVSGLLMREIASEFTVNSLYLYPPSYPQPADPIPMHRFMLLLSARHAVEHVVTDRGLYSEYSRLSKLVIETYGDPLAESFYLT